MNFAHIRESAMVPVSEDFVPILSKAQIHLQQFASGLLDFVYRILCKKFASEIDRVLTNEVCLFRYINLYYKFK